MTQIRISLPVAREIDSAQAIIAWAETSSATTIGISKAQQQRIFGISMWLSYYPKAEHSSQNKELYRSANPL
jgi:hypothetical protein